MVETERVEEKALVFSFAASKLFRRSHGGKT